MTFGDIFYITFSAFMLLVLFAKLLDNRFLETKKKKKFTLVLNNCRVVFINFYLIFYLLILGTVVCLPVLTSSTSLAYRVIALLLLLIWTITCVSIRIERKSRLDKMP